MNIKKIKLSELKPASYNPRTITPEALEGLGKSLEKFGDISGITFNIRTKRLVTGHQRTSKMPAGTKVFTEEIKDDTGTVACGFVETPDGKRFSFRVVDWDEITEKAANAAANSEAISGDWEPGGLEGILQELKFEFPEFEEMRFNELDVQFEMRGDINANNEEDESRPRDAQELRECPKCGFKWEK